MANLGRSAAPDFPDSVGVGSSYPVQNEFVLKVYHEEETPDKLLGCVALKPHQNIGELRYIIRTKLGHRPAFQLFNARQNTLVGPKFSRSAVLDVFQFPQEDVALVRKKVKKIRYAEIQICNRFVWVLSVDRKLKLNERTQTLVRFLCFAALVQRNYAKAVRQR